MAIEFPSLIWHPPVAPVSIAPAVQISGTPAVTTPASSTTTFHAMPLQSPDSGTTAALENLLGTWITRQTGSAVQSIALHGTALTPLDQNSGYDAQGVLTATPSYLVTQGMAHMAGGQDLGFSLQLQLPPGYLQMLSSADIVDPFWQRLEDDAALQDLLDIEFNPYDSLPNGQDLSLTTGPNGLTAGLPPIQEITLAQLAGNYDSTLPDTGYAPLWNAGIGLPGVDILI